MASDGHGHTGRAQLPNRGGNALTIEWGDSEEGFVGQQTAWLAQEREGEARTDPFARRKLAAEVIEQRAEVEQLQNVAEACSRLLVGREKSELLSQREEQIGRASCRERGRGWG